MVPHDEKRQWKLKKNCYEKKQIQKDEIYSQIQEKLLK